MVLVLFANTNFKMYLFRVLSLIQELSFNVSVSVSMSGSGVVDLGVGMGSYQPGVYVPLNTLFLVIRYTPGIYADGYYIVFAFPFVCSFVSSFVIPERSWNLCQSFC